MNRVMEIVKKFLNRIMIGAGSLAVIDRVEPSLNGSFSPLLTLKNDGFRVSQDLYLAIKKLKAKKQGSQREFEL